MTRNNHTERRTTKLSVNLFNKLGPLCEYTQLLKKTEWTEPLHLVHEMELRWCIRCSGNHWYIVKLLDHDEQEPLLGWMQKTGYE